MIPQDLRPLFWDIRLADFDPQAWPEYTIARILEFGGDRAVAWMRSSFSEAQIKEVLRQDRCLTRRSATFWALVYGVPMDEVRALSTQDAIHVG